MEKQLAKRKEVAGILSVSLKTVDKLIERGELRSIKITPHCVRVELDSVREFVLGREQARLEEVKATLEVQS